MLKSIFCVRSFFLWLLRYVFEMELWLLFSLFSLCFVLMSFKLICKIRIPSFTQKKRKYFISFWNIVKSIENNDWLTHTCETKYILLAIKIIFCMRIRCMLESSWMVTTLVKLGKQRDKFCKVTLHLKVLHITEIISYCLETPQF